MVGLLFGLMILFIILDMDIAIAMGAAALAFLVFGGVSAPLLVIPQKMMNGLDSFPLLAVPLFLTAGHLMNRGGVTERLVRFATALVGWVPAGLAYVAVLTNLIMAGVSGSAVADAASTGSVLIPAMERGKYSPRFAAAVIAAAAAIGPVFPPSILLVLVGASFGISIGRLFLGGVIPGVLMAVALAVAIRFLSARGDLPQDSASLAWSWAEVAGSAQDALLALGMPIIILGGILLGVVTPTESAVLAVVYALGLTMGIYRTLRPRDLAGVAKDAAVMTAAVMATVATASIIGWIATVDQIGPSLSRLLLGSYASPFLVRLLMNVLLLVAGFFLEPVPLVFLLLPVLLPVAKSIGMDLVHLAIIFDLNCSLGMIHPPIGLNILVVSTISRASIWEVTKAILPFFLALLVLLLVVTEIPLLVTWLPNLLMKG
jgi:tripartite ATP-independent transporter DctM subunit